MGKQKPKRGKFAKRRGPKTETVGWSVKRSHHQRSKLSHSPREREWRKKRKKMRKKENYIYFHQRDPALASKDGSENSKKSKKSKKSKSKLAKKLERKKLATRKEIRSAEYRSVHVPAHRMVHVRRLWEEICRPIVENLKLQIRM